MHTTNTLHNHLEELGSHVSNFVTFMTKSKFVTTSHMPKLESGIAALQDPLETRERNANDMGI